MKRQPNRGSRVNVVNYQIFVGFGERFKPLSDYQSFIAEW